MITEKQYLSALKTIKGYRKQNREKKSNKRVISDEQLKQFIDSLPDDMIMRYSDIIDAVRDYFVMCRAYAPEIIKRLREGGFVYQEGYRGLYFK